MQCVRLLFILVMLIVGATLSEFRIKVITLDGLAELEDAAIQVLTTCYANQTKTIALEGDYSSSFIEKLSSHETFALVSLHDTNRSETRFDSLSQVDNKRTHKVDILVAVVPNYNRFETVLSDFWYSLYDNPMAVTLILVWSPVKKKAGCAFSRILYYSNTNNNLNAIVMCHQRTNEIMIYTSNPFKNQAPEPWQFFRFKKTVRGRKCCYFKREYRVNQEMCKNLVFDKTRNLNGSPIKVIPSKLRKLKHARFDMEQGNWLINSFILYVNASTELVNVNADKIEAESWDMYEVRQRAIRGMGHSSDYYAYPNARMTTYLVSQFRGNKSQMSKILGLIDEYSRVGMFFVYIITLFFFKYYLRQPLLTGILNLCRLTCNTGLTTLPRNIGAQIYLSGLLSFVVTMQGIFTGNLASLLTHDFPVRQVNSVKDVIDLDYTVYAESSDVELFADPRFKGRIITIKDDDHYSCIEDVKRDAKIVCVAYTDSEKQLALQSNLFVSAESVDEDWACNIVPWRWSLLEKFDAFTGILIAAGAALPFQVMVEQERMREAEAIEIPVGPKVMTWENLRFAFVILAIGLVCATITLIGEIVVHWLIIVESQRRA